MSAGILPDPARHLQAFAPTLFDMYKQFPRSSSTSTSIYPDPVRHLLAFTPILLDIYKHLPRSCSTSASILPDPCSTSRIRSILPHLQALTPSTSICPDPARYLYAVSTILIDINKHLPDPVRHLHAFFRSCYICKHSPRACSTSTSICPDPVRHLQVFFLLDTY